MLAPASRVYADYLAARPRGAENFAICQVIEAARRSGGRAHIVHLSSSDALPMLASARRDNVALTVETCPHYLVLAAEEIADGATSCKVSPPVREAANRELLWDGMRSGTIDLVASDACDETPRHRRFRRRLGRHLLAPNRSAAHLDSITRSRDITGEGRRLDVFATGAAGWPAQKRSDRPRLRRRLLHTGP